MTVARPIPLCLKILCLKIRKDLFDVLLSGWVNRPGSRMQAASCGKQIVHGEGRYHVGVESIHVECYAKWQDAQRLKRSALGDQAQVVSLSTTTLALLLILAGFVLFVVGFWLWSRRLTPLPELPPPRPPGIGDY